MTQLYDKRDHCNCSIVNFPCICSNIPSQLHMCVYIAADSVCMSLFDIRSVFDSRQSTYKQFTSNVTEDSSILFTGMFPQILRSLQRSSFPIQPLGQILFDVFHINRWGSAKGKNCANFIFTNTQNYGKYTFQTFTVDGITIAYQIESMDWIRMVCICIILGTCKVRNETNRNETKPNEIQC
jgi:hypothetical protein